ncbi:glycoside hydrolase superfamily [Aspergillus coremiiformis]|uniref:Glycoside hydrolase superfamily n=1 Tax=Aspergillus coremiiformis TaxID=138285 RepID=A0A5N6ZL43_9EURO|nr:glycoside hydrolase superfamily [Aspergillus coremiiformis]
MKWVIYVLAVLLLSYQVEALAHESPDQLARWAPEPPEGGDRPETPNDADANSLPPLMPISDPFTNVLLPGVPMTRQADERSGISYAPYNADGTCRSRDDISKDMDKMNLSGLYGFVRIYGVDCDQTRNVIDAARQRNLRVFAGVYDLQGFPNSLDHIINAARGDWSVFHTISIGNELVNKGTNPQDVVNAVHTARAKLRDAGYQGPVVTVDTFSVLLRHPQLCKASDYCAANCHAFFDATQPAENAGKYAVKQANRISAAAGGKRTVITESGWPHHGQANANAIPSPRNQITAHSDLHDAFRHRKGDLVMFSAFDDLWKQDGPGTFGAEKYWGILER